MPAFLFPPLGAAMSDEDEGGDPLAGLFWGNIGDDGNLEADYLDEARRRGRRCQRPPRSAAARAPSAARRCCARRSAGPRRPPPMRDAEAHARDAGWPGGGGAPAAQE